MRISDSDRHFIEEYRQKDDQPILIRFRLHVCLLEIARLLFPPPPSFFFLFYTHFTFIRVRSCLSHETAAAHTQTQSLTHTFDYDFFRQLFVSNHVFLCNDQSFVYLIKYTHTLTLTLALTRPRKNRN